MLSLTLPYVLCVSNILQIVRTQVATDQSVVGLVDTMNGVYSFVDAIKAVPTKVPLLADVIQRIFMQTVECAIFIQEYTGQGFGGAYSLVVNLTTSDIGFRSGLERYNYGRYCGENCGAFAEPPGSPHAV